MDRSGGTINRARKLLKRKINLLLPEKKRTRVFRNTYFGKWGVAKGDENIERK